MQSHWQGVYSRRQPTEVSWYQQRPERSIHLINSTGVERDSKLIDVGAGASTLADHLIDDGYTRITLTDISAEALELTGRRLARQTDCIRLHRGDLLSEPLPESGYRVWHDRALFHFMTSPEMRACYHLRLNQSLAADGWLLIATFAEDGPEQCSELPVVRYSEETIEREFGDQFRLVTTERELHQTPAGKSQSFIYALFRRRSAGGE